MKYEFVEIQFLSHGNAENLQIKYFFMYFFYYWPLFHQANPIEMSNLFWKSPGQEDTTAD